MGLAPPHHLRRRRLAGLPRRRRLTGLRRAAGLHQRGREDGSEGERGFESNRERKEKRERREVRERESLRERDCREFEREFGERERILKRGLQYGGGLGGWLKEEEKRELGKKKREIDYLLLFN